MKSIGNELNLQLALTDDTPIVLRKAIKNAMDALNVALFAAGGYYELAANPTDEDTLGFNGFEINFLDTPVDPETDVQIGSGASGDDTDLGITIDNAITLLNASTDPLLTGATYSDNHTGSNKDADRIIVKMDTVGEEGDEYTLDTPTAGNVTRSAATLEGGTEGMEYPRHTVIGELYLNNDASKNIWMIDNYLPDAADPENETDMTAAQVLAHGSQIPNGASIMQQVNMNTVLMISDGNGTLSIRARF